jgi:PTS system fructose-specific IIC component
MASKATELRQQLMTGVSYMIPFVTAGGVLIALAFAFADPIAVVGINVYETFDFWALLFKIGATAFGMLVPILAGYIAYSIADRPGIAPGIVGGLLSNEIGAGFLGGIIAGLIAGYFVKWLKGAFQVPKGVAGLMPVLVWPLLGTFVTGSLMIVVVGKPVASLNAAMESALGNLQTGSAVIFGIVVGLMMAFDMGGPVNKAAYVFATGLLASGILEPMAAVMAAGMTPPLGMALATFVRPKSFNEEEREAGKAAAVMGISFITEGAIPFAAADPGRVIPSIMVGSAVAGALSMAFGATLNAPHGGIFVAALVGNVALYLLAIAIGTAVTAAMVVLLKGYKSADVALEAAV